ncbi:hypothetical protein ACFX13_038545 [Malus domestica]
MDDFSESFYQDHWEVVGMDVINIVKAFWHSSKLLRKLNHTNLVLIPKVSCLKNLLQYRLIALCNVSYKVLAKVLTNRLKMVMLKTKEDRVGMALKLDMAKAYDRVEWEFLLVMMAKLRVLCPNSEQHREGCLPQGVRDILNTYVVGSSQGINMTKSSIYYGSKVKKRDKKISERTLNIQSKVGFGKYLRL